MSSSPHPHLSMDHNSSSMNVSTTYSSSIQVPSITNNYSNSANNSPLSSYTKNSKLDLKINLNSTSTSSSSKMKGERQTDIERENTMTPFIKPMLAAIAIITIY